MRLNSRARYAVAAMVEVACHEDAGPLSLREVSVRHGISLSCLEPIFSVLRKHGLVQSTRGPGGGYSLARNPASIKVAEIFGALGETVYATPADPKAHLPSYLLLNEVCSLMNIQAIEYLSSVSLASLIPTNTGDLRSPKSDQTPAKGIRRRADGAVRNKNIPNSVFALGLVR